jgi:hypothetical protein
MELGELDADERIALVGLVKAVLMADGRVSEEEHDEVALLVDAFGEAGYRTALDAFESRFPDEGSFRQFLAGLIRQDARELIYGTILEGASADAIAGQESELLAWLGRVWGIEVKVEEPPDDEDAPA